MLVSNQPATSGLTCPLSALPPGGLFTLPNQTAVFQRASSSVFAAPAGSLIVCDSNGTVSTLAEAAQVTPRQGVLCLV